MLHIVAVVFASFSHASAQDLFLAPKYHDTTGAGQASSGFTSGAPDHDVASTSPPVVNTECGQVIGVAQGAANVFPSIQYAVAERWKLPLSTKAAGRCWAPATFQGDGATQCLDFSGHGTSENNCLTLNVWSPTSLAPEPSKPVMVYFHGGNLESGTNNMNFTKLAAREPYGKGLVMVDVSYRLSLAGFFSVEAMVAESATNTSGAFGLYDMLESLRWVQRNIGGFGGDPSKVTIFGQSSGGTAVMALLGSPLAKGLFSGAMSLSGSPNISMSAHVQRAQHQHMVDVVGCAKGSDASVMACLRTKSLSCAGSGTQTCGPLILAQPRSKHQHGPNTDKDPSWSGGNIFDIPRYRDGLRMWGAAVVDGDVLREPVPQAYSHAYNDVPVIFSNMAQEGGHDALDIPRANVTWADRAQFDQILREIFQYVSADFGTQVAELYGDDSAKSAQLAFDTIGTDTGMTCGQLELALAAGRAFTSPVYLLYNEQHETDDYNQASGVAYHGSDMARATDGVGPKADAYRQAWFEFASTGKVAAWQPVTAATPWSTTRLANSGPYNHVAWKQKQCDFWKGARFGPEFWWSN